MKLTEIIVLLLAFLLLAWVDKNPGDNFDRRISQLTNKKVKAGDTIVFNCIVYRERFGYYSDSIKIDDKVRFPLSVLTQKRINDGTWELIYFTKDVSGRIDNKLMEKAAIRNNDLVIKVRAVKIDPKGKWNGVDIIKVMEVPADALLRNINEL